jgi:hypothetical protein
MDYEQERLRGRQAEDLLAHPLLVEAFETLENEVIETWKNSPARDEDGREKLWLMLHLSQKVKMHLQTIVQSGKMAAIELQALEKRSLMQRTGIL